MSGTPCRIRDLGVEPGVLPPGPLNAVTGGGCTAEAIPLDRLREILRAGGAIGGG